jgi:hypothetical protein
MLAGLGIGAWLVLDKYLNGTAVMQAHGPLLIFAAVLIVAGVQLLALGLLGEMHVHHYYETERRRPYSVEVMLRAQKSEQAVPPES